MRDLSAPHRAALTQLSSDLDRVFGARLEALGFYAGHDSDALVHTLALVNGLAFKDLSACLPLADGWQRRGLAVPLMLSRDELDRTLDIFPLEYAAIAATLTMLRGSNPFEGLTPRADDVRRALETQAKSHLIHLREGFLESRGEATAVAALIAASAMPFRTLLASLARLPEAPGVATMAGLTDDALAAEAERRAGIPSQVVREVFATAAPGHAAIADPTALLARYLDAADALWAHVDRWSPAGPAAR